MSDLSTYMVISTGQIHEDFDLVERLARLVEASGEHIGEGDPGNVLDPDPEVEIEAGLGQVAALGEQGAQRNQPGVAPRDQR